MSMKKTSYNLLRLLAMFLVVATHMKLVFWTPEKAGSVLGAAISAALGNWLLCCNGLFFMLSGRFILEKYNGSALSFYQGRILKIGVPAFFAAAFQFFYLYRSLKPSVLLEFLRQLLGADIIGYLWFLFPLFGFYLAVPFLSKLFHVLGQKEKKLLLFIGLLYFALENIYQLCKIEQLPNAWPFYGWLYYCVLGYLLDQTDSDFEKGKGKGAAWSWLIPCGAFFAILSGIEAVKFPGRNPALNSFAPSMLFLTAAVYLAVTRGGNFLFPDTMCTKRPRPVQALINRAARASFFLYLLHGFVQNILMLLIPEQARAGFWMWAGMSLLCFFLSLFFGMLAEACLYRPYLRFLSKRGLLPKG